MQGPHMISDNKRDGLIYHILLSSSGSYSGLLLVNAVRHNKIQLFESFNYFLRDIRFFPFNERSAANRETRRFTAVL